jgi:hypothetical protein
MEGIMEPQKISFYDDEIILNGNKLEFSPYRSNSLKFLKELHKIKISDFLKSDENGYSLELIRVVIPVIEKNSGVFNIEGFQRILKNMSEIECSVDTLSNYEVLLLVSPLYINNTDNPYISLYFLVKSEISLEMIIELEENLKKLKSSISGLEFDFQNIISKGDIFNRYDENQFIMYEEYSSFMEKCKDVIGLCNMEELEFILIWGSFNIDFNKGYWDSIMLELNKNKIGSN